jgi:hypothetical protein
VTPKFPSASGGYTKVQTGILCASKLLYMICRLAGPAATQREMSGDKTRLAAPAVNVIELEQGKLLYILWYFLGRSGDSGSGGQTITPTCMYGDAD